MQHLLIAGVIERWSIWGVASGRRLLQDEQRARGRDRRLGWVVESDWCGKRHGLMEGNQGWAMSPRLEGINGLLSFFMRSEDEEDRGEGPKRLTKSGR